LRSSVVSLVCLLGAGCTQITEPPPHLVFDSTAATASLRVGDTAVVIMDVTNISSGVVHVGPRSCGAKDFVLVNSRGMVFQPVTRFALPCAVVQPRPLAPGESTRIVGETDGLVVSERVAARQFLIPPGRYTVRSTITPWDADASTISIVTRPPRLAFRARG
jgi:hypothetical protein